MGYVVFCPCLLLKMIKTIEKKSSLVNMSNYVDLNLNVLP